MKAGCENNIAIRFLLSDISIPLAETNGAWRGMKYAQVGFDNIWNQAHCDLNPTRT